MSIIEGRDLFLLVFLPVYFAYNNLILDHNYSRPPSFLDEVRQQEGEAGEAREEKRAAASSASEAEAECAAKESSRKKRVRLWLNFFVLTEALF